MKVSGQLNAPAALSHGDLSWYSLNERGAGWAPSPVWTPVTCSSVLCSLLLPTFLLVPHRIPTILCENFPVFPQSLQHTPGCCSCDIMPATLHNFANNYALIIPSYCCYFTGVSHADELGYLFHTAISPSVSEDSQEMKVLLKMIRMWTNFAKTGYVRIH